MRAMSDIHLHSFVLNGDSEAFAEIVRAHTGWIYGVCLRILEDEDKAADAVQETFFQLVKHASTITDSLPGWLHRVATRKALDQIRKDKIRSKHESCYSNKTLTGIENWKDLSPFVDEEVDKLDEQTRQILIAHYYSGQTTRQIGHALGLSQATISRKIHTGLDMLRIQLKNKGLLVAAASLGTLLLEGTAQAAPAALISELGKITMIAGTGTLAAGSCAAAGSAAAGKTAAGGLLAGIQAKLITAAAVVTVGTASLVTYHHISRPHEAAEQGTSQAPVSQPVSNNQSRKEYSSTPKSGPVIVTIQDETPEDQPVRQTTSQTREDDAEFDAWFASLFVDEPVPDGRTVHSKPGDEAVGGFGGGLMGMGGIAPEEPTGGRILSEETSKTSRVRSHRQEP